LFSSLPSVTALPLTINHPPSTTSNQPSTINHQHPLISCHMSLITCHLSLPSAISYLSRRPVLPKPCEGGSLAREWSEWDERHGR